jgi:hypothetical protein
MKYYWLQHEDYQKLIGKYGVWATNRALANVPTPNENDATGYSRAISQTELFAKVLYEGIIDYYGSQAGQRSSLYVAQEKKEELGKPEEEEDACDRCGKSMKFGWYEVDVHNCYDKRIKRTYICNNCWMVVRDNLER